MRWHMWLYYYDIFIEMICENYNLAERNSDTAEWAND